jgi:hypothetical protein
MTIEVIALAYVSVGGVIAAAIAIAKRPPVVDVVMVTALWPLYAPMMLVMRSGADRREVELVAAFDRARSSPLAPFVPDEPTARGLGHRLRDASGRLAELDAALARLGSAAANPSAATAALRARTTTHLDDLRRRYRTDLDDIGELVAQLVAHAELVAWDPVAIDEAAELIGELVARLDRLSSVEYDHVPGCST